MCGTRQKEKKGRKEERKGKCMYESDRKAPAPGRSTKEKVHSEQRKCKMREKTMKRLPWHE